MKFKGFLCIVLLFTFIVSFSNIASGSQIQPNTTSNLRIISSNTNLRIGDLGFIRIQGKPGTRYNLLTSYQRGNRTIRVSQMRVTDVNGQTTFNWVVENGTAPRTNAATITGGGESIPATHTVMQ